MVVGEDLECLAVLVEVEASGAVEDHVALIVAVVQDPEHLVLPDLPLFHQRGCLGRGRWLEVLGRERSFGVGHQERVGYLLEPQVHGEAVEFRHHICHSQC